MKHLDITFSMRVGFYQARPCLCRQFDKLDKLTSLGPESCSFSFGDESIALICPIDEFDVLRRKFEQGRMIWWRSLLPATTNNPTRSCSHICSVPHCFGVEFICLYIIHSLCFCEQGAVLRSYCSSQFTTRDPTILSSSRVFVISIKSWVWRHGSSRRKSSKSLRW